MTPTPQALCVALAALVSESGIRHPELARRAGVAPRSLRAYLSGARFPDKHIDALLAELGVSPTRFLLRAASEMQDM